MRCGREISLALQALNSWSPLGLSPMHEVVDDRRYAQSVELGELAQQ